MLEPDKSPCMARRTDRGGLASEIPPDPFFRGHHGEVLETAICPRSRRIRRSSRSFAGHHRLAMLPECRHRDHLRAYLVNRYYDPTTAQFLSIDPLVAVTGEPYQYAGDDPVNGSDPSGLITTPACGGNGPVGTSQQRLKQECAGELQSLKAGIRSVCANSGGCGGSGCGTWAIHCRYPAIPLVGVLVVAGCATGGCAAAVAAAAPVCMRYGMAVISSWAIGTGPSNTTLENPPVVDQPAPPNLFIETPSWLQQEEQQSGQKP